MASYTWPEWKRRLDPTLWDSYEANFIEPGWAGELCPEQVQYIRDVLEGRRKNPYVKRLGRLRRRWGMRPSQECISEAAVRAIAEWGTPDDPERNATLASIVDERGEALAVA